MTPLVVRGLLNFRKCCIDGHVRAMCVMCRMCRLCEMNPIYLTCRGNQCRYLIVPVCETATKVKQEFHIAFFSSF